SDSGMRRWPASARRLSCPKRSIVQALIAATRPMSVSGVMKHAYLQMLARPLPRFRAPARRDRPLTAPPSPLGPAAGHAVPTRRVLSARRDYMTKPPAAGIPARIERPTTKPVRPHFSSGPCAKPPGWAPGRLATGSLGRSHRSKLGKSRLAYAIDLTREILGVPATHRIGIVPASDTGAVEMALWSLLGARKA